MGRLGKDLNNYLTLNTSRRSSKKQKSSNVNTDGFPQYFMKLIEVFKYLPYLGYRKRLVKNKPTKYYFLLVKTKYHRLKTKKQVLVRNNIIESSVINKKYVNETIKSGITSINKRRLELTKQTRMCGCKMDKEEITSSKYDNEDNKK